VFDDLAHRLPHPPGLRPRSRRALYIETTIIGLIATILGMLLTGGTVAVGPLTAHVALKPALTGSTVLDLGPFGTISVKSHTAPVRFVATVQSIDASAARSIAETPGGLNQAAAQSADDLRGALIKVVIATLIVSLALSAFLALLAFRRTRAVLPTMGVTLVSFIILAMMAAISFQPKAVDQPRFTGLLSSAPTMIGNAQEIVSDFETYRQQLAKMMTNVSQLYNAGLTLPIYTPDPETIRVLHVSDLHLNPEAWDVIRGLIKQFDIDFVIDSGDITDYGSSLENRFVEQIGTLGVTYIYVRGNHDSDLTQSAVARQPNAIVLDKGRTFTIEGLTISGWGDPRFTPSKDVEVPGEEEVLETGRMLANAIRAHSTPVQIAVIHDPNGAPPLVDTVQLILSGHVHRRVFENLSENTILRVEGSTGGSGLRALERSPAYPLQSSILYFDRNSLRLQAWDEVTVGGLGFASVDISRHLVPAPIPQPVPTRP
jgi:predicted MPP superfamily phosphohydrolase